MVLALCVLAAVAKGFGSDLWPLAVFHAPLSRPVYCHSLDVLSKTKLKKIDY